jgi:hypothetical protein
MTAVLLGHMLFTAGMCAQENKVPWLAERIPSSTEIDEPSPFGDNEYSYVKSLSREAKRMDGELNSRSIKLDHLPQEFHLDGTVSRSWLGAGRLVTTAGAEYNLSPLVSTDATVSTALTCTFKKPWHVETGASFATASAGALSSSERYVSVSRGRSRHHTLTVRGALRKDTNQSLGFHSSISRQTSREVTLSWKEWVGASWGFTLHGASLRNSSDTNHNLEVRIFKEF